MNKQIYMCSMMCVCGGCREIEEWSKDVYLSTEYPGLK